jgi:hypothetical protein
MNTRDRTMTDTMMADGARRRANPSATRGLALVLAGLWCLASAGCASFTTYKSARPLPKGATQALLAPQLDAAGPKETGKAPFPELAVSVRHGLTERLEVGATLIAVPLGDAMSAVGLEGLSKLHLHRTRSGRIDIAVGAGAGYRVFATSGATFEMIHASVPLIMGVNIGRDHQLVFSPTLAWQRWYSTGARPVDIPSLGASLGWRWQLSRRFAIFPELSFARSGTALSKFDNTTLLHAGVALVFGRP